MNVKFYQALIELEAAVKDGNRTINQGRRYYKAVREVVKEFQNQTFAADECDGKHNSVQEIIDCPVCTKLI